MGAFPCAAVLAAGGKRGKKWGKGIKKRGKGEKKGERGRKSQGIREKGEKDVVFCPSRLVARREEREVQSQISPLSISNPRSHL